MFRILLVTLAFTLAFPLSAFAEDITTDSDITAVTVYTNRAKVERRAEVDVPKGAHKVIFTDVPAGMLPDSLRAEGVAAADVVIGALSYKKEFMTDLAAPKEQELRAKLDTLNDQRLLIAAEKQAFEEEQKFLENLSKQASLRAGEDIAEIDLKPDQWLAAAESVQAGLGKILKSKVALDAKNRELNKEIEKIRRELAQLRTGRKERWQVEIPVEAAAATKLTINLSYQMNEATWQPFYDARLNTETGALELVQYGDVQQHTGEDWTDVALTLSTAQPQRGTRVPVLNPMWVDVRQYDVISESFNRRTEKAVRSGASAPSIGLMAMDAEAPHKEAKFRQANIETGGFISEYKIPGPSTVPADGSASKLLIGSFETENELQIHVKPQRSTDAFLVAHLKLQGDAPVLPGRVNLFRDGAYVGQAAVPLLRPDEEQDLSFGIDDQVAVKRRTLKDERSEAGMISRDNVLERHFVTELQNLHTIPVKVMVMETVPVSKNEDIKVEIIKDATTPGYKSDKDNIKGLTQWELEMAPKAEQDVKLGWKVSWPKDEVISGI